MTALTTNPSVQALAWTLVHFLWQGAALGVVVFLWLRAWRPSAQARYAGGILALAALLAAPVATFAWLARAATGGPADTVTIALPDGPVTGQVEVARPPALDTALRADVPDPEVTSGEAVAIAIVMAWGLGVLLLSLRLAGGWILARRLAARATGPATAEVCALAAAVSRRLGLTRAVRVVDSTAVSVPMLVGWVKPVVLFPASALSGLSAEQIEALIAHELAHVRRHDFLVNILQSVVDTLLFYHPAVWFVSREVREAREQCCDDLAIGVCDRVVYASALADLAAMSRAPRIALAATGGSLLRRVQRLLGQPCEDSGPGAAWLGMLSLALLLGGVIPAALGSPGSEPDGDAQALRGGVVGGQAQGGGVADGIVGGVATAVEGGVSDGVAGDVSVGTPGGVAGGLSTGPGEDVVPPRQGERRPLEQGLIRPADVREIEARVAAIEQQVAAAGVRRQEWGVGSPRETETISIARLQARLAQARAALDAANAEYERSRQRAAVGLLPPSGLREAQARVAAAERALAAAAIEAKAMADEAQMRDTIDARRARLQAESRVSRAELELSAMRKSLDTIKRRFEVGMADHESLAEAQTRAAAAEQRFVEAKMELELTQEEIGLQQARTNALRRLVSEMEERNARYTLQPGDDSPSVVMDAAAQAQPGDMLSIEIAGEPDLPRAYRVDTNGAIRLPLLGAIAVAGLTAQQVRDTVTGALSERQLGQGKTVTVTLRRPK
jgi:beta-lactamase regulating signal transducer with metallopeptidase domain